MQHLEGDQPIVPEIARQVDRGHAPPAELALEQVAVTEGIRQWRVDCGHGDAVWGSSNVCEAERKSHVSGSVEGGWAWARHQRLPLTHRFASARTAAR